MLSLINANKWMRMNVYIISRRMNGEGSLILLNVFIYLKANEWRGEVDLNEYICLKANEWRRKVDFESLDSIPSMLSDRSDGYHISDHMNRLIHVPGTLPLVARLPSFIGRI